MKEKRVKQFFEESSISTTDVCINLELFVRKIGTCIKVISSYFFHAIFCLFRAIMLRNQ